MPFNGCCWFSISVVHYVAHVFNFEYFLLAHNHPNNNTRGLLSTLTNLPGTPNGTWINPIRSPATVSETIWNLWHNTSTHAHNCPQL